MPLSPAATPGVFATSSDLIALTLLTFSLEGFEDLRVVNNTEDIVSRGLKYEAFGFKINLVNEDTERLPQVTLTIDNLDARIIEYIRSLPSAPLMKLEVVTSADNFQSVERSVDFLKLTSVTYNSLIVTGQLVLDNFMAARFPAEDYTPNEFPGLFGIAGGGTYGVAVPTRGSGALLDIPFDTSTGVTDNGAYSRKTRLYGAASVVAEGTRGALRVAYPNDYARVEALYLPAADWTFEFYVNVKADAPAGKKTLVLQYGTVGEPGCFYVYRESSQSTANAGNLMFWFSDMLADAAPPAERDVLPREFGTQLAVGHMASVSIMMRAGKIEIIVDDQKLEVAPGVTELPFPAADYHWPVFIGNSDHSDTSRWAPAGEVVVDSLLATSDAIVGFAPATAPPGKNVMALLHFDGNDQEFLNSGYLNIDDFSTEGTDVRNVADENVKFYKSAKFTSTSFRGLIQSGDNLNYAPGADDWCVEAHLRPYVEGEPMPGTVGPFSVETVMYPLFYGVSMAITLSPDGHGFILRPIVKSAPDAGSPEFRWVGNAFVNADARAWFHLAVSREGTKLRTFFDGVLVLEESIPQEVSFPHNQNPHVFIGYVRPSGAGYVGYMDEFRYTVGHSVYNKSFFPPTAPFDDPHPPAQQP